MSSGETLHLPPVRELALGAVPRLVEGVLIPTALFLLLMNTVGLGAAIIGGFGWSRERHRRPQACSAGGSPRSCSSGLGVLLPPDVARPGNR